jgi:hypothetical protein
VGEEGRGGEQEEKGLLLKHGCTLARARLHWFFCGWWHAVHYVGGEWSWSTEEGGALDYCPF